MKLSKQEQNIMQKKFAAYCIKVLNGEAVNYFIELDKRWEKEVYFSDLLWEEERQLHSFVEFPTTSYFRIMGIDIPVKDEDISSALLRLPEKKREIILMSFFLDMTEMEIAKQLDLVQSTVHYHKVDSLRLLKKLLE